MQRNRKKLLIAAILALAFVITLEAILSVFLVPVKVTLDPAAVPYDAGSNIDYISQYLFAIIPLETYYAAISPIGSAYMISESLGRWKIRDAWLWLDIYDPLMMPATSEHIVRWTLQDFANHSLAMKSYEKYEYQLRKIIIADCLLYLIIWVFFIHWTAVFIKTLRGKGYSKGSRVLFLVAVLLSPTLWSELLFLAIGIIEPIASFAIAYFLLLGACYSGHNVDTKSNQAA